VPHPAPVVVELGVAPAFGNDSVTQCLFFKQLMWTKIGRNHDGAFLKTIVGDRKRGMAVEYYPDVPGAEDWAMKAKELSSRLWDLVEGKDPAYRIVARSSAIEM
jgi:hypothetical protein